MTIITSQEELEQHLTEAREDVANGRVISFEQMKVDLKLMQKKQQLCTK